MVEPDSGETPPVKGMAYKDRIDALVCSKHIIESYVSYLLRGG